MATVTQPATCVHCQRANVAKTLELAATAAKSFGPGSVSAKGALARAEQWLLEYGPWGPCKNCGAEGEPMAVCEGCGAPAPVSLALETVKGSHKVLCETCRPVMP